MKLSECTPGKIVEFRGQVVQIIFGLAYDLNNNILVKIQRPHPNLNMIKQVENLKRGSSATSAIPDQELELPPSEEFVLPIELNLYES